MLSVLQNQIRAGNPDAAYETSFRLAGLLSRADVDTRPPRASPVAYFLGQAVGLLIVVLASLTVLAVSVLLFLELLAWADYLLTS